MRNKVKLLVPVIFSIIFTMPCKSQIVVPIFYKGAAQNVKYIVYKSATDSVTGTGSLNFSYDTKQYFIKLKSKDKTKTTFYPTQTTKVIIFQKNGISSALRTEAHPIGDTCWAYKIEGPMVVYHEMAHGLGLERFNNFSKRPLYTNDIIAFELEGKIVAVSSSAVLNAVKENDKASRIAKNGDLQRALRVYNKSEGE